PTFFFQAEDGIRDFHVTGVQTCALPIPKRPCPCDAPMAQTTRQSAFAAATTASTVMPKCRYRSPAGALAPKVSMPTTAPSRPTYWRQQPVTPASTATRLRTDDGSTDSRYAASWRSNTVVEGIDTTRTWSPSCSAAAVASSTSEPVAIRMISGAPFESFST